MIYLPRKVGFIGLTSNLILFFVFHHGHNLPVQMLFRLGLRVLKVAEASRDLCEHTLHPSLFVEERSTPSHSDDFKFDNRAMLPCPSMSCTSSPHFWF